MVGALPKQLLTSEQITNKFLLIWVCFASGFSNLEGLTNDSTFPAIYRVHYWSMAKLVSPNVCMYSLHQEWTFNRCLMIVRRSVARSKTKLGQRLNASSVKLLHRQTIQVAKLNIMKWLPPMLNSLSKAQRSSKAEKTARSGIFYRHLF